MAVDIRPMVKSLYIVDKNLGTRKLSECITPPQQRVLDSVQDDLNAGKPVRKRILKARQMGFSTIVQGLMFTWAFLHPRMRGLVVSHEQRSSEHLLGINRFYWDTFFAKDAYTSKSAAVNKLAWKETGSQLTITTAASLGSARSQTIQFLHASECGFWKDPETLLTGLNQSIPRSPMSMVFHESTANGVGNWWHRACNSARENDDEFDFLFFGWWEHPEYRASLIGLAGELDKVFVYQDDEERTVAKYLKSHGMDATEIKDRLLWRRIVIATECLGDIEKFHQEYPTTPEEAFISSGKNVFPINHLRAAYDPKSGTTGDLVTQNGRITFIPNERGPLRVFNRPNPDRSWGNYIIGADPSFSVGGDYSCAQVLNRNSWEQCAVYREKCDAVTFGERLDQLGRWYNDAVIAPESTKAGGATIGVLKARNYPNVWIHQKVGNIRSQMDNSYGWVTNWQTKDEAIGNLQKAIYDASLPQNRDMGLGLCIHDAHTYTEMKEYVVLEGKGTYGNSDGTEHDDTVMALAIAQTVMLYEMGNLLGGGSGEPQYANLDRLPSPTRSPMEELLNEYGVEQGMTSAGDFQMKRPGPSHWLDRDGDDDMYAGSEFEGG